MNTLLILLWLAAPVDDVQTLIQEGQFARARELLSKLGGDDEAVGLLKAQLAYREGKFGEAIALYERHAERPDVRLMLAQLYIHQERFADALNTLDATTAYGEPRVSYWRLRSRALLGAGQKQRAFLTLATAKLKFEGDVAVLMEELWLLAQLGFSRALSDRAEALLATDDLDPEALESVAALLAAGDSPPEQLEAYVWRRPEPKMLAALAYAYAQRRQYRSAASLFARATAAGGDFAFEAADQYRMAGNMRSARVWNARVVDGPKRARQRFSIHMTGQDYPQAVLAAANLQDPGDALRYQIAYALYESGDVAAAALHCETLDELTESKTLCERVIEENVP